MQTPTQQPPEANVLADNSCFIQLDQNLSQTINDLQSKVQTLHNQITRLNQQLTYTQAQLSIAYLKIASLQQQHHNHNQTLCMMVVLFAEIESLRNRLNQNLSHTKQQHLKRIYHSKATLKPWAEEYREADIQLIEGLKCQHLHIVQHQRMIGGLLGKTIGDDNRNEARLKIQMDDLCDETSNGQTRKQTSSAINHISTYSHQSSSIQSSKQLSSNNSFNLSSIWPEKLSSTPKFIEFVEFESFHDKPLYKPLKSQRTNIVDLGSFGKISESKNIDSSQEENLPMEFSDVVSINENTNQNINTKQNINPNQTK